MRALLGAGGFWGHLSQSLSSDQLVEFSVRQRQSSSPPRMAYLIFGQQV